MSDSTELTSSNSTKVVGADPATGAESNYLQIDSSGRITNKLNDGSGNSITSLNSQLSTNDILNGSGVEGTKSIANTATLVNISGTNLANRKEITMQNNSAVIIYWGLTSSVTTTTGTRLYPGKTLIRCLGPSTNLYAIVATGTASTNLTESA